MNPRKIAAVFAPPKPGVRFECPDCKRVLTLEPAPDGLLRHELPPCDYFMITDTDDIARAIAANFDRIRRVS